MRSDLRGPALAWLPAAVGRQERARADQLGSFYARYGKRAFDLAVALFVLAALSPVMLLVALAILLADGRPVIFRHVRLGRGLKPFWMAKFRTMRPDSAKFGPITKAGDPRVTRLGAILRRHKLDELPQLWNVLAGDMSLVGPRPDVPGYLDRLGSRFDPVRRLRPGITGTATLALAHEEKLLAEVADPVVFNDDVLFPLKSELNLAYAERVTFRHDLAILCRTLVRRRVFALDLVSLRAVALAHGIDAAAR